MNLMDHRVQTIFNWANRDTAIIRRRTKTTLVAGIPVPSTNGLVTSAAVISAIFLDRKSRSVCTNEAR